MLSARQIQTAKPQPKRYKLNDRDGLFLLVQPNGSKLFYFRYTRSKRTREISIGKYPALTLSDARKKVIEYRHSLDQGIDPFDSRQKNNDINPYLFKNVAYTWLIKKQKEVVKKHGQVIESRLNNYVLPFIGHQDMRRIRSQDIMTLIDEITDRGYFETATRILNIISNIFKFGVRAEICEFDITQPLVGYIKSKPTQHMPTLTDLDDISGLLRSIWNYRGEQRTRYGLRISAYTFLRPGEIRGLEWNEVFFDKKTIEIPAAKMKMRRTHIVPLADQSLECLKIMHEFTGDRRFVFANPRRDGEYGMSDNTINSALKRLGYQGLMVAHGFRGMASTILHEQGFNSLHIEMQLAHAESNKVKAAYNHAQYLADRTKMMQSYADYLDQLRLKI